MRSVSSLLLRLAATLAKLTQSPANAMNAERCTCQEHDIADPLLSSRRRVEEPNAELHMPAPREPQTHVPRDEGVGFAVAEIV